jgi:DNA-binding NtrC family response regulator
MDKNKKASLHHFPGSRSDINNRPSLGDVLIVSGDETSAISMEKILNDNLYGVSVASNGDQVIGRLKHTWYHLILIDLDSIDVPEYHLAKKIRITEPDIPIIGLGNQDRGPCPDITYLKKPLTVEKVKDFFPQAVTEKETKGGRKALGGLVLAGCISLLLWLFLIWIWK